MKKNLLFAFIASQVFTGASAQLFGEKTLVTPNLTRVNSFIFADMDGDGDTDIVATRSTGTTSSAVNELFWLKNLGDNTFSTKNIIASNYLQIKSVQLLDVDEDGIKDLVVGENHALSWVKSMGGGFFGTKQLLPFPHYLTNIKVADINNDGRDDIIIAQLSGDVIMWTRNDGGGQFSFAGTIFLAPENIHSYDIADLDEDGVTDLFISMGGASDNKKLLQIEYVDGAFVQTNIYSSTTSAEPYIYDSSLFDIDGDGKIDVLTNGGSCETYWFKNFGNNVYSSPQTITNQSCGNVEFYEFGDINLDGFIDAIYRPVSTQLLQYRLATGVGTVDNILVTIGTTNGQAEYTQLYDFDGDGDLDLFVATSNEFAYYPNNAAALSTPKNNAGSFKLYPNPAANEINIASATAFEGYKIYDYTGKLVASQMFNASVNDYRINIDTLTSGLYIIDILSGSTHEIQKFVKN